MKIKKKNTTIPINGKIVDTENVEDKTSNAPSMRLVEEMTKEKYSTDEQVIGTWVDGKPLYRKVVTGIYETQALFEILNVLKMVNMYGTIKTDIVVHQLGAYYSSNYYSGLQFNPSINTMKLFAADIYRNNEYTICLEYTKTTD